MTATQSSPIAALLGELHSEARATRRLFERLPEDKLGWRPHPRSMTLGQLALHVASVSKHFAEMLGGEVFDVAAADFKASEPADRAEIQAALEQGLAAADGAFSSWTADDLDRTWRVVRGEQELMSLTKGAALRSLLCNHTYHHRGQLAVYLRLLDVELPSVYGPTADENPFA